LGLLFILAKLIKTFVKYSPKSHSKTLFSVFIRTCICRTVTIIFKSDTCHNRLFRVQYKQTGYRPASSLFQGMVRNHCKNGAHRRNPHPGAGVPHKTSFPAAER